jgi:SsrA-binding protein
LECGLVLQGSEVKSLRSNQANISDSFARIEKGEIWLYGMDIPEYTEANQLNHKAKRRRKMLLNRSEIRKFEVEMKTRGKSLIPLELYFKKGKAKISLALGLGQKFHDKRENIKKKETQKDIAAFQARKRKGS